jgi:CheY-like chemotaxis protein
MVVDDDLLVLKATERALRTLPIRLKCIQTAPEALKDFQREPVDLILSDVNMPDMDGITFISCAKEIAPDVWCVLQTGDARLVTDCNIDVPVILKPVEPEELKALVAWFLGPEELAKWTDP